VCSSDLTAAIMYFEKSVLGLYHLTSLQGIWCLVVAKFDMTTVVILNYTRRWHSRQFNRICTNIQHAIYLCHRKLLHYLSLLIFIKLMRTHWFDSKLSKHWITILGLNFESSMHVSIKAKRCHDIISHHWNGVCSEWIEMTVKVLTCLVRKQVHWHGDPTWRWRRAVHESTVIQVVKIANQVVGEIVLCNNNQPCIIS